MMNPKGASTSGGDGPRRASKKPKYSRFTQQELPACKLMLTLLWVITTFGFIGIVFIPIGLASLSASALVVEIVDWYDIDCIPAQLRTDKLAFIQSSETNKTCTRSLTVPKHMKSPVYIYYQLDNFYQNHRSYHYTTMLQLSQQEDLIVWMRPAALPTFRKLYGRIEEDLEPNEQITVVIQNNYNTYSFGGKKKLVLSTTSWIGGKNDFLGMAYLTVGGLCLILAVGFILVYAFRPRTLGDPSYLSWSRNAAGYLI